jgi:hypothetical protein
MLDDMVERKVSGLLSVVNDGAAMGAPQMELSRGDGSFTSG